MMKILVINGPNLNMLGIREPGIYGKTDYNALCDYIKEEASKMGDVSVELFQSNHEGAIIDKIQEAYGVSDGIVLNAGAYTHYSYAILDALKAVGIPTAEVHISDIHAREEFRHNSVIKAACCVQICGKGIAGYVEAINYLRDSYKK
jgi:3-dehydroquinate dehydratase-2